ncbi:MAG: RNA-binding domain-containing protein, partial [Nanoarchaeota archaeon]
MKNDKILELIKNGESQEVEFKEGCPSNSEISETLCAFANTDGGYFIFGVNKKGEIKGLTCNLDKFQQDISNANQAVHSAPIISANQFSIEDKKILAVQVNRANDKNAHTFKGVIYVRIGSTTKRLEGQSLFDFLKNKQIMCFDEQESEAKLSDLDEDKIKYYLKKRDLDNYLKSNTIKDFVSSNTLGKINGEVKLKNVTALFFSKEPHRWFAQNEMRVVKFEGIQPINIIAQKDFISDPIENIEKTLSFIKQHISKRLIIPQDSPQRVEIDEYPHAVLREAVVNSVVHRDYFSYDAIQINIFDDRIEISNPGGLPDGLPAEFFGKRSVRRNPITYRLLRDCKFVEGLGTGIPKIINEMRKSGLRDPEFNFEGGFFVVVLRNAKSTIKPIEGMKDLNSRQTLAIEYLRQNKTLKSKTYANMNNVSLPVAIKDLNELAKFKY